jgi:cytochrome c-type biogenesis protein CcmH/NrfG
VRARPNVGAVVDSLGWVYYRMGDIPKAIENLERAAELDAADPAVNDHLGDAYLSAGRKLEAVYQWQRVLTLRPDDKLKTQVQSKINQHQGEVVAAATPAPAVPTP